MDASTISLPAAGRRRGRYSDAFKAEIVAACKAPGISTVAVALANSLNANLVRRWVLESDPAHQVVTRATSPQAPSPALPLPPFPSPSRDFVPCLNHRSNRLHCWRCSTTRRSPARISRWSVWLVKFSTSW